MKILLTGAAGQLGQELCSRLSPLGALTLVDRSKPTRPAMPCLQADLADPGQLEMVLQRTDPDLVVNAAAYTAVDRAEQERQEAFSVNADLPGRIARWAARHDRAVLHYSTDYVFDGSVGRPYRETDSPCPLNAYGESKLAGERAVAEGGCRALLVRTSWVYSAHGNNFVLSMLRLAGQRLRLSVVNDQVGCPTWARNLADASLRLLTARLGQVRQGTTETYHYCDRDAVSWYDFAARVFAGAMEFGLLNAAPELSPVASADYPQVARRPAYSVLDTTSIRAAAGVSPAPLAASLHQCLEELAANE
ncbi:MAG: dTDP-4-dehydrorhamnose reductase [Xanthomonadales bacterium]|nr:dTDP-4-dehydrorhamnose reductase [Xanthomonadales bacterium]NIN58285.1 dTDP-4-dehydrorhamnose reductase [Xanthomonadales bacterium]NIN73630.1 dTDP-4-dehydrorhamnose reductase [Xanthomonadales bacterium]NIO14415.1 dTDP-4-dehydrorhamnose reductase [Xanthomonadales bacterium]NIP10678.1 dTDP-4-dehydrorhamnose reductase [Xanthomonadales bacterium]